ncbi:guanyl-nucleotide exchange factor, putative [Perkinsus marinus ATCC 50983]|uniref:Guanyl-nucleotide exchange factor, putative n=1 Tax=Perkinsus marinus (strain ATCC 50983 / TXsc) TaxID=423536 RepID=C5LX02_PERM5|nr:guanyl-nucleotide exchange factor, putative [Perkinsus marinus ATCC 50983]EEQ98780.1 guanyl-nucleotide exchange factor, putative [Perkinsus marinus ATCC 50983]|eukprot:XP_002766063.1 guanyl-nucleotide exchange factor, putative [Perkinsus marinus ATCC 50983]
MSTLSQSPTATTSKADLELRKIIDAGVLRFNNSAKDGIKYLISAGVLDDDPAEIAEFLAKQENLDKHVIGEYLGKDNEFNIAVLNRFAQLFDYRDLPADEALRLFMCRWICHAWRGQQVYRILERFSTYYAATCSSLNRDQVHILAYALIMLNVDAHNPLVTDKMTRDQFINNTMPEVSPGCTAEELGQMYDRIVAKEFRPDTTPQELMYVRLAKNPQYSADEKNVAASAEDIHRMKKGDNFLKFGRRGRPHPRRVFLSEDESRICWMEPTESRGGRLGSLLNHDAAVPRGRAVVTGGRPATAPPASEVSNGGTGGRSPGATSELMVSGKAMPIAGAGDLATTGVSATHSLRNIRLDEVTGLCVGTSGSSVFRKQWVPETAPPGVDMRMWLRFFHYVLSEREAKIRASADPVKEALEMQRAGAKRLRRWKEEILPNWAKHWTTGSVGKEKAIVVWGAFWMSIV